MTCFPPSNYLSRGLCSQKEPAGKATLITEQAISWKKIKVLWENGWSVLVLSFFFFMLAWKSANWTNFLNNVGGLNGKCVECWCIGVTFEVPPCHDSVWPWCVFLGFTVQISNRSRFKAVKIPNVHPLRHRSACCQRIHRLCARSICQGWVFELIEKIYALEWLFASSQQSGWQFGLGEVFLSTVKSCRSTTFCTCFICIS